MKRDESIDTMRGIGAFCVMWAHVGVGGIYGTIISPIMLPIFFFVSGYLLKPEMKIKDFIKTRILNLLFPWIVISYVEAYCNVSDMKRMIKDVGVIKEIGIDCTLRILQGSAIWFVPALLVCLVIGYGIIKICRQWQSAMAVSLIISVLTYFLARGVGALKIWNISCAMINQVFIVAGYYIRRYSDSESLIKRIVEHWAWLIVYVIEMIVFISLFAWDGFNVRNNGIQNIFLYFLLCFSGLFAVFALTRKLRYIPLLTFMGSHSLLYFAFGPHGYIIGRKILEWLPFSIIGKSLYAFLICTIACVAWIIPALIIDRICPILNGKWKVRNTEQLKEGRG